MWCQTINDNGEAFSRLDRIQYAIGTKFIDSERMKNRIWNQTVEAGENPVSIPACGPTFLFFIGHKVYRGETKTENSRLDRHKYATFNESTPKGWEVKSTFEVLKLRT